MNITDQFRVPVSAEEAWRVLLDVERIAPCLPGAQLQEVEGDDYRGVVKVKVGPISAQYKGAARIVEADEQARRIVLQADGRDTRGQGTASATITVTMAPDGDGTVIGIDTDLNVTGRVAQFGRGVMADVSSKLLKQFAQSLETDVLSGGSPVAPAAGAPTAAGGSSSEPETGTVRVIESRDAAPIDLMATAGGALVKRVVPVLVVAVLAVVVWLVTK
ncbi:MAG TPA: SRPBCC family protein [Acidimicrobiales bacterium]|nr:SRPBCC family protein [Acidimicrobiales bacterium]